MTIFEARQAAQAVRHRSRFTQAPVKRVGRWAVKRPATKTEGIYRLACGQKVKNKARQAAQCGSSAEVRHCLSVPTGKPAGMAASGHPCGALRPGQITPGRQVGRPLSPARVRAMPETFVVIERP